MRLTELGRNVLTWILVAVLVCGALAVVLSDPLRDGGVWYLFNICYFVFILPLCVAGIMKLNGIDM